MTVFILCQMDIWSNNEEMFKNVDVSATLRLCYSCIDTRQNKNSLYATDSYK